MRIGVKRVFKATKLSTSGLVVLMICSFMPGCMTWNSGLKPEYPSYGFAWTSTVDSLTPTLRWKPYTDTAGKEDIRYQLEIIEGNIIIMSRDDIRDPFYTLDRRLDVNTQYLWHVRPLWTVGGNTQRGPWNHKGYFFLTPIIFGWGSSYYKFTTPEK